MKTLRILLRVLGALGVLLLTLFTLAVSGVNWVTVTQYWVLIVLGGAGLSALIALLAGVLARVAWKTRGTEIACGMHPATTRQSACPKSPFRNLAKCHVFGAKPAAVVEFLG